MNLITHPVLDLLERAGFKRRRDKEYYAHLTKKLGASFQHVFFHPREGFWRHIDSASTRHHHEQYTAGADDRSYRGKMSEAALFGLLATTRSEALLRRYKLSLLLSEPAP